MTTAVRTSGQIDRTSAFMEVGTMKEKREELNRTIWSVIISEGRCKKDMKAEVKLIKDAGYQINKYDTGKWEVYNPTTKRKVMAQVRLREITITNSYWFTYRINTEGINYFREAYKRRPIDFVGILEKPINEIWREVCWLRSYTGSEYDEHSTLFKYKKLKDAKWSIKWRQEEISRNEKKLADIQKDLVYYVKKKAEAEIALEEVRRNLGLKARR